MKFRNVRSVTGNRQNIYSWNLHISETVGTVIQTSYHWGETWCANVHVRASKMEERKSGAQTRCHFSHLTLIFRLEIDIQESSCLEWIHAISNLNGSVLYFCWAACEIWRKMHERTWYDALTYIASKQRMRERTLRCANERFLVPTNEHRLLASQRYHL